MYGEEHTLVNGDEKSVGNIFYPFRKFVSKPKKVLYKLSHEELNVFEINLKRFQDEIGIELDKSERVFMYENDYVLGEHGHIYKVSKEETTSPYIHKPLATCLRCMSSLYGMVTFLIVSNIFKFNHFSILEYTLLTIVTSLILCAITPFIHSIIKP